MLDKLLSDPQWAQVGIAALVALFTFGTLVAVAVGAYIQVSDRRERSLLTLPEVEADVSALAEKPCAFSITMTVRNFGITSLEIGSLEVVKPKGALLLDPLQSTIGNNEFTKSKCDWGKATKTLNFDRWLRPVGSISQGLTLGGGSIQCSADETQLTIYIVLPSPKIKFAKIVLYSRRKSRSDREMSTPVLIRIPAAIKSDVG